MLNEPSLHYLLTRSLQYSYFMRSPRLLIAAAGIKKENDTLGLWPRHTDTKATRAHVCLRNTIVVVPRSSCPPTAASTPIAILISLASL